jgi:hypothetical protein
MRRDCELWVWSRELCNLVWVDSKSCIETDNLSRFSGMQVALAPRAPGVCSRRSQVT